VPTPTDHMAVISFLIPRAWKRELEEVARERSITLAALGRLVIGSFLRGRYTDSEREVLEQ